MIFEALNFAAESPAEVTTRVLHVVAADSLHVGRPAFHAQVAAYRDNPTTPEVRHTMGLTLLADAIAETKATPEACASALSDLGQLPPGCEKVVGSIANQMHEIKNNFHPGKHVCSTQPEPLPPPIPPGPPVTPIPPTLVLPPAPRSPVTLGRLDAPQYGLGQPSDPTPTVPVVTPRAWQV